MQPSRLLRVGIEIEYKDWPRKLIYRGRPFWVSEDGQRALTIPEQVRERSSKKNSWRPFDHNSFRQRATLFNSGPVSQEQMDLFILPDAPPFFWHRVNGLSKTRVKFGDGHSYGESGSYIFLPRRITDANNSRYLMLKEPYSKFLPEPFLSLWEAANPRCSGVW